MNHDDYEWTEWWRKRNSFGWKTYSWLATKSVLKALQGLRIKSVLELGGGSGLAAKKIAQHFRSKLTLLDNDQGAYEAFLKFSNCGEYLRKDALSFKTKRKWDLVFSLEVLEHFPKKQRLEFIKIHQRLSLKYILIAAPSNSWFRRGYSFLRSSSIEKLYSEKEFKDEIKEAGLKLWRSGKTLWWNWALMKA